MSDTTWNGNGFNIADAQHTQDAITAIRTAIQVTSYLNDAQVNSNWATVVQDVTTYYRHYQERVLAVDGAQINPAEMYQEFVREVVIQDIENSADWIRRRIGQLQRIWQPLVGQDPEAQGVLDTLQELDDTVETLLLNWGDLGLTD